MHQPTKVNTPFENVFLFLPVPDGWRRLPMPEEDPDFRNPAELMPLAVFQSPSEAMLVAAAVRPAGQTRATPRQWLEFMCGAQRLDVEFYFPLQLNGFAGAGCCGLHHSEAGTVRVVSALYITHGAVFTISAAAPDALWNSVGASLEDIVRFARLTAPSQPEPAPAKPSAFWRDSYPALESRSWRIDFSLDSRRVALDPAVMETFLRLSETARKRAPAAAFTNLSYC